MNKRGFTLIELLAVILILGIIALIAIPTVNKVIKQSRAGSLEATGNQMVKSLENYKQMCDLSDGVEADGTTACKTDFAFTGTVTTTQIAYNAATVKSTLDIKGDIPDTAKSGTTITAFKLDENGNALIRFIVGGIKCNNDNATDDAIINGGAVKCGDDFAS